MLKGWFLDAKKKGSILGSKIFPNPYPWWYYYKLKFEYDNKAKYSKVRNVKFWPLGYMYLNNMEISFTSTIDRIIRSYRQFSSTLYI